MGLNKVWAQGSQLGLDNIEKATNISSDILMICILSKNLVDIATNSVRISIKVSER